MYPIMYMPNDTFDLLARICGKEPKALDIPSLSTVIPTLLDVLARRIPTSLGAENHAALAQEVQNPCRAMDLTGFWTVGFVWTNSRGSLQITGR